MLKTVVAALMSFTLLSVEKADAAPIFPSDFWVYEFEVAPRAFRYPKRASTFAPIGTPVPAGCTGRQRRGELYIDCEDVVKLPGISKEDLRSFLPYTYHVAFNATEFRCHNTFREDYVDIFDPVIDCPPSFSDITEIRSDRPTYTGIVVDYDSGSAIWEYDSYNSARENVVFGYTSVSIKKSAVSGVRETWFGGEWDYGYGGGWSGQNNSYLVGFGGTGSLTQIPDGIEVRFPSIVPLPAPLGLLLAGIVALSAVRQFGSRSKL